MAQKKNFKDNFKSFLKYLKGIVFPQHIKCIFCGDELNGTEMNFTCEDCLKSLPFISNPCPRCGGEIAEENSGVCVDCKINNYHFENAYAVFNYQDNVLNAIHKLKYNGKKNLAEPFAMFMAQAIATKSLLPDIVTSVPIHNAKLKQRKFNQAELLAKEVCSLTGLDYIDLCEKVINTPSQTSLTFSERKANVKDSFKVIKQHIPTIKGKTILIIDDVFTTGATTSELSKTLLVKGAKECYVLTLAHVNINKTNLSNQKQ